MSDKPPVELKPDPTATEASAAVIVYGWLLDGHTKGDIADSCRTLWAHLDPAKVILTAMDAFAVSAAEPPDSIKGWCIEATRALYRKLLSVGDYEGALRAIKQLHGLAAPTPAVRKKQQADALDEDLAALLKQLPSANPPDTTP